MNSDFYKTDFSRLDCFWSHVCDLMYAHLRLACILSILFILAKVSSIVHPIARNFFVRSECPFWGSGLEGTYDIYFHSGEIFHFFIRVHATLQPAFYVGRSVGRLVGHILLFFIAFISLSHF